MLEHHFDNHAHCGDFCVRSREREGLTGTGTQTATAEEDAVEEDTVPAQGKKFYRSKDTDRDLYLCLKEIVDGFVTMERLTEVAHGCDTNLNEALNNAIAWCLACSKKQNLLFH